MTSSSGLAPCFAARLSNQAIASSCSSAACPKCRCRSHRNRLHRLFLPHPPANRKETSAVASRAILHRLLRCFRGHFRLGFFYRRFLDSKIFIFRLVGLQPIGQVFVASRSRPSLLALAAAMLDLSPHPVSWLPANPADHPVPGAALRLEYPVRGPALAANRERRPGSDLHPLFLANRNRPPRRPWEPSL